MLRPPVRLADDLERLGVHVHRMRRVAAGREDPALRSVPLDRERNRTHVVHLPVDPAHPVEAEVARIADGCAVRGEPWQHQIGRVRELVRVALHHRELQQIPPRAEVLQHDLVVEVHAGEIDQDVQPLRR